MAPNRKRTCQCGCGTKLDKQKPHGRFLNVAHRQRAYRARKIEGTK